MRAVEATCHGLRRQLPVRHRVPHDELSGVMGGIDLPEGDPPVRAELRIPTTRRGNRFHSSVTHQGPRGRRLGCARLIADHERVARHFDGVDRKRGFDLDSVDEENPVLRIGHQWRRSHGELVDPILQFRISRQLGLRRLSLRNGARRGLGAQHCAEDPDADGADQCHGATGRHQLCAMTAHPAPGIVAHT